MNEINQPRHGSRLEGNPADVLNDAQLSDDQKCDELKDWLQDLLELQTATGESMGSNDDEYGQVARQYQRVNEALRVMRETSECS